MSIFGSKFLSNAVDGIIERRDDSNLPWSGSYSGWGGEEYFRATGQQSTVPAWSLYESAEYQCENTISRIPIVFIHGNGRSADDWRSHASYFLDSGYNGDELWAITFQHPTPTHEEMADQLDSFITEVRNYTGCQHVNLVAHSLGVTGARYWMQVCNRYEWVDTFVGIGGANHGISSSAVSPPTVGSNRYLNVLRYLHTQSESKSASVQLKELNENETPGDVEYYTIRGTYDSFYVNNPESPELSGANENVELPMSHNQIQTSHQTLTLLEEWLDDGGQ